LIAALIDQLQATYNIDRDRIYVNGLSNGGGESYALSCVLNDRIAAVGAVAPAITMSPDLCPAAKPIPLVVFHGTGDRMTPYQGAKNVISPEPFPDIRVWLANWARRNHCASTMRESAAASDVTRIEYENCAEPVVLYRIDGGGHTWPGGQPLPNWFAGPTNDSINATELMWSFFKDHPRRAQ
jgi:polyhydroxybutyrate depolymerase